MTQLQLIGRGLSGGLWEGLLSGAEDAEPRVSVTHVGQPVEGVEMHAQAPGEWALRIPVPARAVTDGVQTIVIADEATGTILGSFTLIAGDPLAEDLRAEIALLRAELDLLKTAFRRHAVSGQE